MLLRFCGCYTPLFWQRTTDRACKLIPKEDLTMLNRNNNIPGLNGVARWLTVGGWNTHLRIGDPVFIEHPSSVLLYFVPIIYNCLHAFDQFCKVATIFLIFASLVSSIKIIFVRSLSCVQLFVTVVASLVAQLVKTLPVMQETLVPFLGWEDPQEKG